jgi:hypothetical protein
MIMAPRYWKTRARFGEGMDAIFYVFDAKIGWLLTFDQVFPMGHGLEESLEPSPDGKWLLSWGDDLMIAPVDRYEEMVKLPTENQESFYSWLPDSSGVLTDTGSKLRLYPVPLGEATVLAKLPGYSSVALQGSWIAVRSSAYNSPSGQAEMTLLDFNGGQVAHVLMPQEASGFGPSFYAPPVPANTGYITGIQGTLGGDTCTYAPIFYQWTFSP